MIRVSALSAFLTIVISSILTAQAPPHTTAHYVILAGAQGPGSTAFAGRLAAIGGRVEHELADIGVVLAESSDPQFPRQVRRLRGVLDVAEDEIIQLDLPRGVAAVPGEVTAAGVNSEPNAWVQWNLRQIGADRTAAAGMLGWGAVVAVVDSGINSRHPELAARIDFARSRAFTPSLAPALGGEYAALPDWEDDNGHGSHVAGIIAASINDYGIQGVAPESTIIAVKVLGADNTARSGLIIAGILYAASQAPDVINLSLGHTFDGAFAGGGGVLASAYQRAVIHATTTGALVVAGAGNESANLNSRLMALPVQLGTVMGVAATGPDGLADFDRAAAYTNYGRSVIDIAAPGGDIVNPASFPFDAVYGTWSSVTPQVDAEGHIVRDPATGVPVLVPLQPGAGWFRFAWGTSMAAPHVSAVAALLVGRHGRMHPAQLAAVLEQTAVDILTPGADPYSGRGRVDAAAALDVP